MAPARIAAARPLRILFLTRYDRLGASSRQRCLLYLEALRAAGIAAEIRPFLSDAYVRARYAGRPVGRAEILRFYAARLRALALLSGYDLVWIEKEALPWMPAWVERAFLKRARVPVVIDYDDALFHIYDRHPNPLVRRTLGAKIDRVMRAADLVIVGNSYLGARARAAGVRAVAELPTVVDLRNYPAPPPRPSGEGRALTIGWIGSPITSPYLDLLRPALAALAARIPLRLLLIGAAPAALAGLPVERVPWSEGTEAAEIARCDVGVMPLPDQPWERGKCGYKLIQFMAGALPVIASPVGVNCDIVIPGETGFLAACDADWVSALSRLHGDPELRRRMGEAGRRRAEQLYSLRVAAPCFVGLLRQLATAPRLAPDAPPAGALP
ncbi:MAG TPA: glycosyltransferase [Stellaceae bacterium]|nr:glycosyltransferase [Stellaceae bacterium]